LKQQEATLAYNFSAFSQKIAYFCARITISTSLISWLLCIKNKSSTLFMATRRNRTRKNKQEEENLVDVVEIQENQSEGFLEDNQNTIFGVLVAAVVLIGLYMLYSQFYKAPKEKQAVEQMTAAQFQFSQDSFALALTNPGGGFEGFSDLANNYSGTAAGNSSELYAGISYLQLGEFDAAIEHLKDYDGAGEIGPILKNGLLGDAFAEKNDLDQALGYYKKAVNAGDNQGITPYYLLKQGMLELKNNNNSGAKDAFTKIKEQYPTSRFAQDAEKYLMRATAAAM